MDHNNYFDLSVSRGRWRGPAKTSYFEFKNIGCNIYVPIQILTQDATLPSGWHGTVSVWMPSAKLGLPGQILEEFDKTVDALVATSWCFANVDDVHSNLRIYTSLGMVVIHFRKESDLMWFKLKFNYVD